MNKLISKVVGACLGVALASGVGVAVFATSNKVSKADAADSTTTYQLVNSTDDLEVGKSYIFTSGTSGTVKSMSTASNNNNRRAVDVTVSNGKITRGSSVLSLTLGGSAGAYTFYTENYAGDAGYLASAASGNNNYCRVIATETTGTISFSGDEALVNLKPHNSRKLLSYNTSNGGLFACYSSKQNSVYLWKEAGAATTFSVTYDANGGTGTAPVDNTAYNSGATVTVLANSGLTNEGYTFTGWNTAANGTGTSYTAGDTFSISANTILYAQWEYNVHYTEDTSAQTITWDLTLPQQVSASNDEVSWDSPRFTFEVAKGTSTTNPNNYLPPAQNTSRFYTGNVGTFASKSGNAISSVTITAATNNYATAIAESTWTNANAAAADDVVTVTPTNTSSDVTVTFGATIGIKEIVVYYGAPSAVLTSIAVTGSMTKTSYEVGDAWDATGLVVTATYSDNSTPDVTTRVTWSFNPASASAASITSVTATATFVDGGVTKSASSAAQTVTVTAQSEGSTDAITVDKTDAENTSYVLTEGIAGTVAVYASQNAKAAANNGGGLQYRSNNSNSGIVSTTSGGVIKSVTVEYAEGKTGDFSVWGKNTAYTNPTDLYNNSLQGTQLGTITATNTVLTIEDDYQYVGVRSTSGSRYILSITFVWEPYNANEPSITIDQPGSEQVVGNTGTLTATTANAGTNTVAWSSSDSSVVLVNETTGAWEAKKIGAAVITATLGSTGKKATITITVTGSVNVAEARALIDQLNGSASGYKVTVSGYVTSVSGNGTKNQNNSIYIADTKGGTPTLQIFIGYNAVSNWADVAVVDAKISAKGNLTLYNGTAYEMTNPENFQLVNSDRAAVQDFVNAYMHMTDYDPNLDNSQGNNSCLGASGYYMTAKGALVALSETQISLFQNDAEFANAKARYEAWAHAYGDSTPYATTVGNARFNQVLDSNNALMIIVIVSLIGVTAVGAYFYLRKKKEQ